MRQRFKQWRRSARNREAVAYESYTNLAAYPLFLLGMLFLIAFMIPLTPDAPPEDLRFARIVIPLTWFAFALDFLISITISPQRWHYVRTHLVQLAALLFPPLRVLLIGHVFHVLRTTPVRRGDRARTYVLYLTTLLLVVGAVLVVYFESKAPNANITSFGDALWWGGETVSTVGYGDYYPITVGGRLVAGVLFVNGVALLSIITAGLAQNFTSDDAKAGTDTDTGAPPPANLADASAMALLPVTRQDLQDMHERLDRIEAALGRVADRLGAQLDASGLAVPAHAAASQSAPVHTDTPRADTPGEAPPSP